MKFDDGTNFSYKHKLQLGECIISFLWIIIWGMLSYKAISEKAITLGGRNGINGFEGMPAVVIGFIMFAASLWGFFPLLRLNPFKQVLKFFLFLCWLSSVFIYFTIVNK